MDPAHLPSQSLYEQPPLGSVGDLWERVGVCRHVSAEGRGAEWASGQSARRETGSSISLTAHFAQWTKNRITEPQAPSSVLCHAAGPSFSPWVRLFCWVWASLGCTCCGDLLIHLLGRDAWFAHWKDKLLILFSVILSQGAKAHLTGLT